MELQRISIHPREIQRNDRFVTPGGGLAWTAVEDAVNRSDATIRCEVRFADGGLSERAWSAFDASLKIVVERRS